MCHGLPMCGFECIHINSYCFQTFVGEVNLFLLSLSAPRLGEACNHVAALLFAVEDYVRNNQSTSATDTSCTSRPCQWNKPRSKKLSPKQIHVIRPVNYQYGKKPRQNTLPTSEAYKPCSTDYSFLDNVRSQLKTVNPSCAIFGIIEQEDGDGDMSLCGLEQQKPMENVSSSTKDIYH